MTLEDLTRKISYKKVFNEIYRIYLQEKSVKEVQEYDCKFYGAWNNLTEVKAENSEDEDVEKSCIFVTDYPQDGDKFIDVCLLNKTNNETYSIDFLPWENLIDKEIETNLKLTPEKIAAHILWEITFWGWSSNAVKQAGNEIIKENESL